MLTITEVAREAGVRPSTLRYYESIGLLPDPARVGGRRRYEPGVLQRLAVIQTARSAGFSLAELRVLFDEILTGDAPGAQWHELIHSKRDELDALLRNVLHMKALLDDIMQCDDPTLVDCLVLVGQRHRTSAED